MEPITSDRIPFMPTILEYAAAMIKVTPSRAAQDGRLMADAHIEAWRRFGHDAVTVGIDVYNAEAEALGCEVRYFDDNSVPGISKHPGAGAEPADFAESLKTVTQSAIRLGRLPMLLDAASRVKSAIGSQTMVGLGVSGPFSVCCELMGFEDFIFCCHSNPEASDVLLGTVAAFLGRWCCAIAEAGLGITLFESWAAPPLLSPRMFHRFAAPWDGSVIASIRRLGGKAPALVIGGDTSPMLEDIVSAGTSLVVADYNTFLPAFASVARQANLKLRGNVDPKLVASGPSGAILRQAKEKVQLADGYRGFILGTGVLPYDTPEEHVLALKAYCRSGGCDKQINILENRQ